MDNIGIKIGADEKVVTVTKDALIEIINLKADQLTIQKAIDALASTCGVSNTMVSNCNIMMSERKNQEDEKAEELKL